VPDNQPILSVKNLTSKPYFEDISFDVLPGEVLGIYGFMGCGQLELARALFGHLKPTSGEIFIDGKKAVTLRGDNIAGDFEKLVQEYVEKRYGN